MMNAYDKTYLEDAMYNLGAMAEYGVNRIGISERELWSRFLVSGIASRFSKGEPNIVAGHSGPELALMVLKETGGNCSIYDGIISISTPQYWAGQILAYYQWLRGYSFKEMAHVGIGLMEVCLMFYPMHESDLSVFVNSADGIMSKRENWLKRARKLNGLTQEKLAEQSGIGIRLIRAYEQETIDTKNAEAETIRRLERFLHLS